MHPLNSPETAVCIDKIHENIQPNEYIKHADSPYCLVENNGDNSLYHTSINGKYRTNKDFVYIDDINRRMFENEYRDWLEYDIR